MAINHEPDIHQTEEGELVWLTENEIREEQLFPSVRAIVDKIFDPNIGTIFARFEYKSDREIDADSAMIDAMAK